MNDHTALWACSLPRHMPNNLPASLASVGLRPPSAREAINRNLNHKHPRTTNRLETYHNKWTEKVDSGTWALIISPSTSSHWLPGRMVSQRAIFELRIQTYRIVYKILALQLSGKYNGNMCLRTAFSSRWVRTRLDYFLDADLDALAVDGEAVFLGSAT